MSDDLLSLVTGGQQSFAPAAVPKQVRTSRPTFADDTDAMIRTVYGEADPQGRQAVAAVIRNRAQASGKGIADVVLEPGQFEAWHRPENASRMMALKADSPEYQQIASEIAPVIAGKVDPTGGADSYYAPKLQADLGRNKPSWDDGTGQQIGSQLYFKGKYGGGAPQGGDDLLSLVTGGETSFKAAPQDLAAAQQPAPNAPRVSNEFVTRGSDGAPNSAMNPAQQKTFQQLAAAGVIDVKKGTAATDAGTLKLPYVQTSPENIPEGPGVYYVDLDGRLQQTPGKPVGKVEGLTKGAEQGVRDVYGSVVNLERGLSHVNPLLGYASDANVNPFIKYSPFISDDFKKRSEGYGGALDTQSENDVAARDVFDARYGANGYATGGRIAGNIAASAPIMGAGGVALDAAGAGLGPVGQLIAGTAGKGGAGIPNLLLRGTSLATRGALEGAAATGATSSTSDAPIQNQLTEGAMLGAPLALAAPAVVAGFKSAGRLGGALLEPVTETGQNKIVNRFLQERAAGAPVAMDAVSPIPGVQRTTAQSIVGGNSGLSALERSTKATNTEFSNQFDALMKSNNEARKGYLSEVTGSKDDLAAMKQQADAAAATRRDVAFSNAGEAAGQRVAQHINAILESPAGANSSVRGPLERARATLVSSEDGLIPTHRADFDSGIMKAMGSDAAKPTQDALQANKDRLGAIFEEAAGKTSIKAGDDFKSKLGQIVHDAGLVLSDGETAPLIKQVQGIIDTVDADGIIPGKAYQKIIAKDSPLDRLMRRPVVGEYGADIRNVLDDALQSSAKPEDIEALKLARSQYRNMKIAEGAINKAGPDQLVDPAHLLAAVKKSTSNYAYKGGGDLGKLAETAVKQSAPRDVFETRPHALEEVFNQLDDAARKPGAHQAIARARNAVLDELDTAAPGYRQHVIDSQLERIPIAEKEYLHSLALDADEHLTLGKVSSALKKIEKARNASGPNDAKALTKDTLNKLYALRDDLQAEAQSNAGRGAGSDTAQKLATAGMTKALGASKFATNALGVAAGLGGMASGHGPVESVGAGAGIKLLGDVANNFYGAKNAEIQNKLIAALLDPQSANLNGRGISLGGLPDVPLSEVNKLTGAVKKQAVPAGVILGRNAGLIGNTP